GKKPDEDDPDWKDWKREQVTQLVRLLKLEARKRHPGIRFSTTGLMPYSRAYHEGMQDWKRWLESGLVDFVTLMCYAKDVPSFEDYLAGAKRDLGDLRKTNIAVGAYALVGRSEIYRRQHELCDSSGCRACVVLHYGSLLVIAARDA